MPPLDQLLRRLGAGARPSKTELLMRARRRFDAVPWDEQAVADRKLSAEAFLKGLEHPGLEGLYISKRSGQDLPVWGMPKATALYERGNRVTRRHEVMHGIWHAAQLDPELAGAVPVWARNNSSFADELLARLASQQKGAVLDWPIDLYRKTADDSTLPYWVAEPVIAIGRNMRDHPYSYATGAGLTAAGAAAAAAASGGGGR